MAATDFKTAIMSMFKDVNEKTNKSINNWGILGEKWKLQKRTNKNNI